MDRLEHISKIVRSRRSIFPHFFDQNKSISKETIMTLLENANSAPTHKKTEPWRFTVITGDGLQRLSDWLEGDYRDNAGDQISEIKLNKIKNKPLKCAAVIAIIMERHEASGLPEWEEIAAVSCAVQNLWLSVSAAGLGGYWSSPSSIDRIGEFLHLSNHQKCLGFFYLGVPIDGLILDSPRNPIENKVKWVE